MQTNKDLINNWRRRILISREEARKVKEEVYSSNYGHKDSLWAHLVHLTFERGIVYWYLGKKKKSQRKEEIK